MAGLAASAKRRPLCRAIFSLIWDKLGIVVSGLCLLDCLVLPLLSTLLVSLKSSVGWFANLHFYLLPVIGVTALMAFHHSYKAHRSYGIVIQGVLGFALLVLGEVSENRMQLFLINWVSLIGTTLLITAHLRNLLLHTGHRHKHVQAASYAQSAQLP
jgi:hypothetical protein